jgi:hypothetical protein
VAVLRIYGETKVISVHIHNANFPAHTISYHHKASTIYVVLYNKLTKDLLAIENLVREKSSWMGMLNLNIHCFLKT